MSFFVLVIGFMAGWFMGKGQIDTAILFFCGGFVSCFFEHLLFPPEGKR